MADEANTPDFKLKFTARVVDKIERKFNVSIENLLGDTSVRSLAFFIEMAFYDEDKDKVGVNNEEAYKLLENYLKDHDKEDLIMDIMEALQATGFLSRKIEVDKMRQSIEKKTSEAMNQLENEDDSGNSGKK